MKFLTEKKIRVVLISYIFSLIKSILSLTVQSFLSKENCKDVYIGWLMGFCFRFVCLLACLLVYLFVFEKRQREGGSEGLRGCMYVWVGG